MGGSKGIRRSLHVRGVHGAGTEQLCLSDSGVDDGLCRPELIALVGAIEKHG